MLVERLDFNQVEQAYPDRWRKARPGNQFVNPHDDDPGRYIVRRQGSDEWHEITLVSVDDSLFGRCDCDGFEHHDGPCSHLCAVFRIVQPEAIYSPPVTAADVDLRTPDEQRAQTAAEPDVAATDGGVTRR